MKHRRALIFALFALAQSAGRAIVVPGDLDHNYSVTMNDARIALSIAAGLQQPANSSVLAADVSPATAPDKVVTLADVVRIARAASGLDNLGRPQFLPVPMVDLALHLTADTEKNYQIPSGFLLRGTLKDASGNPSTSIGRSLNTPGYTAFVDLFDGANTTPEFEGAVEPVTGDYSILVPAGTYRAGVLTRTERYDPTFGDYVPFYSRLPLTPDVTVNADTTQDYVRPALPDLPPTGVATVTGTIQQANLHVTTISYSGTGGLYLQGAVSAGGTTFTVSGAVPGTGYLTVTGWLKPEETKSASVGFPSFAVSPGVNTVSLTVPTLGVMSGTVSAPPDGPPLQSIGFDGLGTGSGQPVGGNQWFAGSTREAAYSLVLAPDTYRVRVNFGGPNLSVQYQTIVNITAFGEQPTIVVPALPASVAFRGTVLMPDGAPAKYAAVEVATPLPVEAPGFYVYMPGSTDRYGAFDFQMPTGTYNVNIRSNP